MPALPAPAPPPPPLRGWAGARERWEGGVLLPFEKLMAVLAVGQMMRISLNAVYVWSGLNRLLATKETPSSRLESMEADFGTHQETGEPVFFFRVMEKTAATTALLPQPAAFKLLESLK